MTNDEKAKAYDEALEAARKELGVDRKEWEVVQRVLHNIFPELRESESESEDERMIRKIESFLSAYGADYFSNDEWREIEVWLEKQKEQKPVEKQDYSGLTDLERAIHRGFLVAGVENVPVTIIKETAQDCLAQNPAWSEEDIDKMVNERARKSGATNAEMQFYRQGIEDTIKSLRPQPKQEWSKEDEMYLSQAIETLEHENYLILADKLKSIRPPKDCSGCSKHLEGYISGRSDAENKLLEMYGILLMPDGELHMKPRWKPSEEQMENLEMCFTPSGVMPDLCVLESLYNNLKELI